MITDKNDSIVDELTQPESHPAYLESANSCKSIDDESSFTAKKRKTFWNRYLEAVDNYLFDLAHASFVSVLFLNI